MENDPLPHNMFFRRYFLKATLTGIKNEQKDGQTDNTNYVVNLRPKIKLKEWYFNQGVATRIVN